ncbi:DNA-binding MarR family transcriptional regulator [Barrientosiimonas humi]|uniref:DNA-binding MarR family transcriptional regulator n=1 Tax=Barrientosiimonas humi TaxID=999931 RepID=A0A542XCM3_9MICO|nr:MarR family transcriptional regulator [Barrientosiimonas humi]TQL33557.1 DNA-binding MarR family transcriptional regulator [Barrientosiimonas humi]CAG7573545.1 HTH-type transcriptional regulator MhqR [Barrientosiimonas humi]
MTTSSKLPPELAGGLTGRERETWREFARVSRAMEARLAAVLADTPVSTGEFGVLIAVAELGGSPQMSVVAGHLSLSPSDLSHRAARLERKQLLRRSKSSDDARATTAELTDEGRALLAEVLPTYAETVRGGLLARLSATQQRSLVDWLRDIRP